MAPGRLKAPEGAMGCGAAMLATEGVGVRFGQRAVLGGVSFSVSAGQWLMVVGPNGAGKSTLVNAITQGVPYSGTVLFDGLDVSRMRPAERARRIGMLAQSHFVGYPYTVEQIVRLGRYAYGEASADDSAVERALALTGMSGLRGQPATTLSGGELQRAFLAQALAQDPAVLLLDEPTSHLDIIYQKQALDLLSEWLREKRRAVVSVMHDVSLARMYGTHALLLNEGRAEAFGPVGEALCDERLDRVYGMDVRGWMSGLLSQWSR